MLSMGKRTFRIVGRAAGVVLASAILLSALASPHAPADSPLQLAYIGPGAGFAFLGSFFGLLFGFLMAAVSFIIWPFRFLWRLLARRRTFGGAHAKKLIVLGLDGLDPRLVSRFMSEGKLPALQRLKEQGSFSPLRTTFPALSPVAWSTFATGVNPAKHNVFDFLSRDARSYLPELSSSRVHKPIRVLRLGRYRIPISRPFVETLRKSRTFWSILGEHHVPSTILRVPITFPPERFYGRLLSAMCIPDLLGTQGTFSVFTTRTPPQSYEGGNGYLLKRHGAGYSGAIAGPPNDFVEGGGNLQCGFTITPDLRSGSAELELDGSCHSLRADEFSPWIRIRFRGPFGIKVRGLCRFLVREIQPELTLYVSPIHIDPEKPALPISHPSYYASYLAKLLGPYSTLGLAEDTWALNEDVISKEAFLQQAYDVCSEREAMFFSALEHSRRGVIACVFDTPDRIQHMFFRELDEGGGPAGPDGGTVVEDLYRRMDRLVDKTLPYVDDGTVLLVLSDHGFAAFRRGVDLNAWLRQNGFLALQQGADAGDECFQGVDWSNTRAYALGLAGIYINQKGRESCGIVAPGSETEEVKQVLVRMLSRLSDEECDRVAINGVFSTSALYRGPYLGTAPDLLVAFNEGYRTSWSAALGRVGPHVFEDNLREWSGDHCIDPKLVPGVLFSNRKITATSPGLEDLAPTALELFGLSPPGYMDGRSLFSFEAEGERP